MKVANFPACPLRAEHKLMFVSLLILFGFGCNLKVDNPCDPGSDNYNLTLITKSILGDTTANCGISSSGAKTDSISSFLFADTVNGLSKTYIGKISGNAITVSLPYPILSTAIPSFTVSGTNAAVAGVTQVSGVTSNDFRNPIIYSVGSQNYTVTVTPFIPIPDTGQTSCSNATANIPCADPSFPRQDGDFTSTPNARAFSVPTQHITNVNDYTTKDNLSGLVLKSCTQGLSGAACTTGTVTTMGWIAAANSCTGLNSVSYAGKTNWRLATLNELANIVNYENNSPSIDLIYFPATSTTGAYWTSLPYAINTANSWNVDFSLGTSANTAVGTAAPVRCVAGDTPPTQSFTDNGDGTVTDTNTNLLWQKCPLGLSGTSCTGTLGTNDWATALATCNNLSLAGKSWRLPNINELRSIIDHTKTIAPTINISVFPATGSGLYWASSTRSGVVTFAWVALFSGGSVTTDDKITGHNVRCVTDL